MEVSPKTFILMKNWTLFSIKLAFERLFLSVVYVLFMYNKELRIELFVY